MNFALSNHSLLLVFDGPIVCLFVCLFVSALDEDVVCLIDQIQQSGGDLSRLPILTGHSHQSQHALVEIPQQGTVTSTMLYTQTCIRCIAMGVSRYPETPCFAI